MNYSLFASPPAYRAFRKLPHNVKKHLWDKLLLLQTNPKAGEQLTGKYRRYRSLHLAHKGTQYRAAYRIDELERAIYIVYIATRENFYRELDHLNLRFQKEQAA